jgi:hypothetical protein
VHGVHDSVLWCTAGQCFFLYLCVRKLSRKDESESEEVVCGEVLKVDELILF